MIKNFVAKLLRTPQFKQKRPALGAIYATVQIGAAAASIGTFVHIAKRWDRPYKTDDVRKANAIRFGVQWPATILFWSAYLASYGQGQKEWKNRQKKSTHLNIQIGPETVMLSARFRVL